MRMAAALAWSVGALGFAHTASGQEYLVDASALAGIELSRYWQARVPLQEGESLLEVWLLDENLYCSTTHGEVFAVRADVGLLLWSATLGRGGVHIFPPSHMAARPEQSHVLFTTPGHVHMLDRATGESYMRVPLSFAAGTGAIANDEFMFVGGLDRHIHCVRMSDEITMWRVVTDGSITSMPALLERGLYFASQDGKVYACDASNKQRLWILKIGMPIFAPLRAGHASIFVSAGDRSMYRIDALTGRRIWRYQTPGLLREPPNVTDEAVYQYSEEQGVFAVNVADGRLLWHLPQGRYFLARNRGRVFVLDRSGNIVAVEGKTGKVLGAAPAASAELAAPNTAGDAIYLADRAGTIICIRGKDVPYLRAGGVGRPPASKRQGEQRPLRVVAPEPDEAAGSEERDPLESGSSLPPIGGSVPPE